MKSKRGFVKVLILTFSSALLSPELRSQNLNAIEWATDIDFLAKELPAKHYNLFTEKNKSEFNAALSKIKTESAELSNFETALRLQQIISGFGDSHTRVNYGQFIDQKKQLPLHTFWFKDGLFILHTTPENKEILGHQILSVNGVALKTISDSLSSLLTIDNKAIISLYIPRLLPLIQLLDYFGFAKDDVVELDLKDLKGNRKIFSLLAGSMTRQNRVMVKPDSLAHCYINERAFFSESRITHDNIYYLQYNRCWSKELELQLGNVKNADSMPSFAEFEEKVFASLAKYKTPKVVFDLRFNSGGSSKQGTLFIEKYTTYLKANPATKTYVVLGRNTFSSAILNAMDLRRLTNAVFIGEETAGKPNHFGEVRSFQLPSSKLRIDYSTKYFKRTSENINTLTPDVILDASFSDFMSGLDPVYEWVKKN